MTNQERRCGSCKHWRNPWDANSNDVDNSDWRAVGQVPQDEQPRWGTCELIALGGGGENVSAFTQDASDYLASLHTRDDFGCVLWEAK